MVLLGGIMGDNRAAEKVIRNIEREKQKGEAIKQVAEEGLKRMFSDIQKMAKLSREIQEARNGGDRGSYQEWLKRFSDRQDVMGGEFTGYEEDRPWERE
jgi:hypothetical protein